MAYDVGAAGDAQVPPSRPGRRRILLIAVGGLVAVLLVVALGLLLRDSPGATLARAVDTTLAQGTAQVSIAGLIRDVPLAGDLTLSVAEGDLDMAAQRARLRRELPLLSGRDLPLVGPVGEVELVYADGGAWIRGPFDTERSWARIRDAQDEAAASAPGLGNPLALLALIRAIEGTPEEIDVETVGGVETTRYRVLVDLDALDGDLGTGSRRLLESLRTLHEDGQLPMDVWIDDDDLIRGVRYDLDIDLPALPVLRLSTVVELDAHGEPVDIAAPSPDEVIDVSADRLRELGLIRLLRAWLERLPFIGALTGGVG